MDIRLLGPVQAWRGGTVLTLGPRQQRLVLAILALEVNRVVPVDRLVDLVWSGCPTPTARQAIRVCVSRLRAALGGAGGTVPLTTVGTGYELRTDPLGVDAHRFRALVDQARDTARDVARVGLYRRALQLWRGPALTDVAAVGVAEPLTRGLEQVRLAAVEECLSAELRLGRHLVALEELIDLVARHPYHQRFVALLMLALHRAGRPGDALAAYRTARSLLADDLGLDPQPRLCALELAILRSDPALDVPAPDHRAGTSTAREFS